MLALRRALSDPERCQHVVAHRLIFCESTQCMPTQDLLLDCWCCDRFFVYCCSCTCRQYLAAEAAAAGRRSRPVSEEEDDDDVNPYKPCHYYKVVYVDGSCLGNGREAATAGIGIAIGSNPMTMHWAIPVDDEIDPSFVRTSQRAELLAAIHGIHKIADVEGRPKEMPGTHSNSGDKVTWVITSDSDYVVLGMTEWVPAWKNKGWRNASGRRPKNLDLFQRLDATVDHYEREYGVRIAFWRIGRVYNELADELAASAARGHTIKPVQFEPMYSLSDEEIDAD